MPKRDFFLAPVQITSMITAEKCTSSQQNHMFLLLAHITEKKFFPTKITCS